MTLLYRTRITTIGPEVMDLLEGGVVILFRDGAPSELAEVSVLHAVESDNLAPGLEAGGEVRIGGVSARVTAVGATALRKVAELGHVVISFNGAQEADRPGEICTEVVEAERLRAALAPGAIIELHQA